MDDVGDCLCSVPLVSVTLSGEGATPAVDSGENDGPPVSQQVVTVSMCVFDG